MANLTVVVEGLKIEGTLYISLFNDADGYPMDPEKAFRTDMKKVSSKRETFIFKNIPFDTYAVSVWHDQNDNEKIDTNIFGVPTEGLGASNNAKGRMGPPRFRNAAFKVDKKTQTISITINY